MIETIETLPSWIGNVGSGGLVVVIVWLILTDRLRPAARADRELRIVEQQRDEAVKALREAHEVNRIHAEALRETAESLERLADSQEVTATALRAIIPALPPNGG